MFVVVVVVVYMLVVGAVDVFVMIEVWCCWGLRVQVFARLHPTVCTNV